MSVFISHSSKDKPAVEALAVALRQRDIDVWLDKWEIGAGDDIVASINAGLDEAGCGIIVFSVACRENRWVEAEVSYLTYARIKEGKALIPVLLGEDAYVPPLFRPLARRGIDEVDAIADAVLDRKVGPPPLRPPEHGRTERVLITLRKAGAAGVQVAVSIGGETHVEAMHAALPRGLVEGQEAFLRGVRHGVRRDASAFERRSMEASLAELGRTLAALCLPGNAGGDDGRRLLRSGRPRPSRPAVRGPAAAGRPAARHLVQRRHAAPAARAVGDGHSGARRAAEDSDRGGSAG